MSFAVPVLLIAFNRPIFTQQVLAILRDLKPARLYVACDGPRLEHDSDAERCARVRQLIKKSPDGLIDWDCDVSYRLSAVNKGCRSTVVDALDWLFSREIEAIILEDDILPDSSFFPYCRDLLSFYRDDYRVGCIAANNHQRIPPRDGSSYRFSIYSHGWGWATWKRAWAFYDRDLSGWPAFRDAGWLYQLGGKSFAKTWTRWLDVLSQEPNESVWDMIWQFSCWQQGFLTILPAVELVENIGFGSEATHTLDERSPLGSKGSLGFPLVHPRVVLADRARDADTFNRLYRKTFFSEFQRKARKAMRLMGWR